MFKRRRISESLPSRMVLATHNSGKVREIREWFQKSSIVLDTLSDLGISEEPEETESTFLGNARLKALSAVQKTGKVSLADDSGLVVPSIDGKPGVLSARWAKKADGSLDFYQASLRIQEEVGEKDPQAYFVCALAVAWPQGGVDEFEGICHGRLTFPPRGDKGFGYDPIFIKDNEDMTFAEMDPERKKILSHRAEAFRKLCAYYSLPIMV